MKTFKGKSENISKTENMELSRNKMEGKQAWRVKEKNETTETSKDMGKPVRGKKARMRNLNLTWVATEEKESVF